MQPHGCSKTFTPFWRVCSFIHTLTFRHYPPEVKCITCSQSWQGGKNSTNARWEITSLLLGAIHNSCSTVLMLPVCATSSSSPVWNILQGSVCDKICLINSTVEEVLTSCQCVCVCVLSVFVCVCMARSFWRGVVEPLVHTLVINCRTWLICQWRIYNNRGSKKLQTIVCALWSTGSTQRDSIAALKH